MQKKITGLLVLLFVYIVAATLGAFVFVSFKQLNMNDFIAVLLADIIATAFVWLMGIIFKTASMYDPYWSLQTLIIYLALLFYYNNWNLGTILLLVAISIYSIRLTTNFIIGFDSLSYVDWRYKMLSDKSGKLYPITNLFGICMFPTLVVYCCSLPTIVYANSGYFTYLDIIGLSIIILGVLLEFVSDIQMKRFIKIRTSRSEVINIGLWKYSRHPNYLGEILIWFGVAAVLITAHLSYWYLLIGAVINLLMFVFISIPMEEKHLKEYKENYDEYLKATSPLLILPNKKEK